jgi:hypothetical protein
MFAIGTGWMDTMLWEVLLWLVYATVGIALVGIGAALCELSVTEPARFRAGTTTYCSGRN